MLYTHSVEDSVASGGYVLVALFYVCYYCTPADVDCHQTV